MLNGLHYRCISITTVESNIQKYQSGSLLHRGKIQTRQDLFKSNCVYLQMEVACLHHEFLNGKACQTAELTMSNILPNEKPDSSHMKTNSVLGDATINQE